ncbi:Adenylate-forming reductase 06235 [Linum grandiflorum]
MGSPVRFLSCRGVAFEIKPRNADPFAVPDEQQQHQTTVSHARRFSVSSWIHGPPSSSKVAPSDLLHHRSVSLASSTHFCDLDDEVVDVDVSVAELEEGRSSSFGGETEHQSPPGAVMAKQPPPRAAAAKKKSSSRLSIILFDQGLFTVYKQLFAASFTLNAVGIVTAAMGGFPYGRNRAALFSIGNIFALTMCRSEAFLRLVFWAAVKVFGPTWVPLWMKTFVTSILQSLGGVHSGCGVSSVAWLIYGLALALNDRANTSFESIIVAWVVLSLIFLSCIAAFPLVRHLHHNVFERTHRFAGWTALGFLWGFVMLTVSYEPKTMTYNDQIGTKLVRSQEFWFTLAITILTILPWLTVRKVSVKCSSPSNHATLIKFSGGVKPGILGRISPSPLSEWHAFGIISDGKIEHSMLCGVVGDFTKSLVSNPPTHLWVRQVHFAGLPYLVNMYDKVLLVATGSGICVFLSFLLQPCKANVCVLWVAKGIEQNFGLEIKEMMNRHPKDKVIVHDTALMGRPNVSQMSVDAAQKWGAEVVVVTSNPEGSRDVVNACKGAGIPAFGPIWDS